MRKFALTFWILLLVAWPVSVDAGYLGVLTDEDYALHPLLTMDTLGLHVDADSFQVVVVHESTKDNEYAYFASGDGTAAWVMTATLAGIKTWWFRDQVANIDSNQGAGAYSAVVYMWQDLEPNPTFFSWYQTDQVGYDTLLGYVALLEIRCDSILTAAEATRDSLQYLITATGFSTLTASDNIGINWGDVTNQGTSVDLSATTIDAVDDVTGTVGSVTANVTVGDFASGVIDDDAIADAATEIKADTTGISENVANQVWREDLTGHNVYGGAAVNILALAPIQALALAPGSHEQTTTRLALNLTATTDDLFNGCLIAPLSGVNEGRTVIIADHEAYSGDSGVVIVSPPLVLAATENQLFVITGADHAEGDTNTDPFDADVDSVMNDVSVGFAGWMALQGDVTRTYVWTDALNPSGKYITNSDGAVPIALDDATGSLDKDDFEDDFFETMSDTNRIRNDSLFALAVAIIDSLNKVLDSIYLANYNATSDCEGVGNYTCTLYVTDTLNDWRVPWVNVSINTQAEDGKPRTVNTGPNGRIIVQYSDGDYRASCLNVMLRNNEGGSPFLDFTVDGAPVYDSLMGYLQSVGNPVSAEACSVYGWLYDVESSPVAGATIIFDLVSDQDTLYYDNVTYLPGRTIAESNSDGYWSICVVPNELLDTQSFYSVDIIRDHQRAPILEHSDVYVPDSATVKFNDLLINFNRGGK